MLLRTLLGLVLIFVVFIEMPIAIIYSIWLWVESLDKNKPWIKFKNFISLYNAYPDKWNVRYDNPECRGVRGSEFYSTSVEFKFNYIDYYRYKWWQRCLNKQKSKDHQRKQCEKAMEILGSDMLSIDQVPASDLKKDPRIKALAKDIVDYAMKRKEK